MILYTGKANSRLRGERIRHGGDATAHVGRIADTTPDALDALETALRLRSSEDHARRTMTRIRAFLEYAKVNSGQDAWQTVTAYLADHMHRLGWSAKTAQNHAGCISAWFDWVGVRPNPCSQIKLPKVEERLARYLTSAEIEQAMAVAADHGIANEVQFALTTGLRLSELIRLKWTDIDQQAKMLIVRKSKSHRQRAVPLCTSAIDALARQHLITGNLGWVFAGRQTHIGCRKYVAKPRRIGWWIRAAKPLQASVPAFLADIGERSTGRAWHLLRHTFASVAAQRGISLYKIAQWLGHTDTRTTEMYAHLATGYDDDIEIADPLRTPTKATARALDDDDIAMAAAGIEDILAVIKRAGLTHEIPTSAMAAVTKILNSKSARKEPL